MPNSISFDEFSSKVSDGAAVSGPSVRGIHTLTHTHARCVAAGPFFEALVCAAVHRHAQRHAYCVAGPLFQALVYAVHNEPRHA